jgi:hypothetical protein
MNNDKQKLDLEGLLAEVEHAGRDARRRDELAAMVDSMAGARKHGFWWWTVRVAAAACVIFFISTAIRIWFIPTNSAVDDNLVAQAEVPEVTPVVADTVPTAPVMPQPVRVHRPIVSTEVVEVEKYVAEEVPVEKDAEEEPVVEETVINVEDVVVPEPAPIAQTETTPQPAEPAVAPTEERKPKRESIFKSIFRRHEPSKMDGTMLVLNIL